MKLLGSSVPTYNRQQTPVAQELRYFVRRGNNLVAAFASRADAGNWTRDYSNFTDSRSTFRIHTDNEVLCAYQDGSEVEVV